MVLAGRVLFPFCFDEVPKTFSFTFSGSVAEWLGGGLQNLSQRFESARYLLSP